MNESRIQGKFTETVKWKTVNLRMVFKALRLNEKREEVLELCFKILDYIEVMDIKKI